MTGRQLVGGRIPPERVEAMLHRLAQESGPVLSGRAAALTRRGPRAALAVGGGVAVTAVLIAVLALVGRVV